MNHLGKDSGKCRVHYYAASPCAGMAIFQVALYTKHHALIIKCSASVRISFLPSMEQNWDPCLQILDGHIDTIASIAFSHDSKLLASASYDSTIRLWLVDTGEHLRELNGHDDRTISVAFSHDSSLLVSASHDRTVRIWRTDTGDCIKILSGHTDIILSMALSHDSAIVASGSRDHTVRIWDMSTGKCIHGLICDDSNNIEIQTVVFSPNSALVAAAHGKIHIWSTTSGVCTTTLPHIVSYRSAIFFSPDSKFLAATSKGCKILFWRIDTGECERIIDVGPYHNMVASFAPDWSVFVYISEDGIRICPTNTEHCVESFYNAIQNPSSIAISLPWGSLGFYGPKIAISYDSKRIALTWFDETVHILDAMAYVSDETLEPLDSDPAPSEIRDMAVRDVLFSHDSTLIATSSWETNIIKIWSADTGQCLHHLGCQCPFVDPIMFSQDSSLLGSVSCYDDAYDAENYDGYVCIWKADAGIPAHKSQIKITSKNNKFRFSHNLKHIAVGHASGISLYCVDRGILLRTFSNDSFGTGSPIFFSDNTRLLGLESSGKSYRGVHLWNIETGESIYKFSTYNRFTGCAFSNDLAFVAIILYFPRASSVITVHRTDTSECVQTMKASIYLDSVIFSHDSLFLITGRKKCASKLLIWRVETGELIHELKIWSLGDLGMETNKPWVLTGSGLLDLDLDEQSGKERAVATSQPFRGYGISSDGRWIMRGKRNFLRLPKSYVTEDVTVRGDTVALLNQVWLVIIKISTKDLQKVLDMQ